MRGRSNPLADRIRVFIGDPALTEDRANTALAEIISPDRKDLDLEVLRLPDDPIDRIGAALCQVGMFARGRCVLLKGSLEEPAHLEWLLRFLETRFPSDAALIIATPKIDGRSKLYRWLQEHAAVTDLRIERKPDGRATDSASLTELVVARVVANGFPPPAMAVVETVLIRSGTSIAELCNEIDRLCLGVGAPRALTANDVAEHVRDAAAAWIFDFVDAVCERRVGAALGIVARLLADGDAPLRIVATLSGRVAEFLVAARYAQIAKLPPPASSGSAFAKTVYPSLPEAARLRFSNPYRAYHVFRVGQARGARSLRRLHRQLLDLDLALKSGGGQPRHLLADFVTTACGPGA